MGLLRCIVGTVVLALSATSLAQQIDVTDADMLRVRGEQPTVTEADIARARQRHAVPDQLDRLATPQATRSPNLDALPVPATTTPLDLGAVAEGYALQRRPPDLSADTGPRLYVFVSLSMPEPTLQRLIAQAAKAHASILVRGLAGGSLPQTVSRLQTLIGEHAVSIQIDPRPYDQFAIERVPAFVLARHGARSECTSHSCPSSTDFVRTTGDVSLEYAMVHVQRTAPAWAHEASIFLHRLER